MLAAAVALPLMLTGVAAWMAWQQAWREASSELIRTADAAAEYARRVLDSLVLRVDRANDLLAGLSDEEVRARETELHAVLRRAASASLGVGDRGPWLFVFDRNGFPLVSGNVPSVPRALSASQREFSRALRAPGSPAIHVSPVYIGRISGVPFFAIAKRRERTGNGLPPGSYDGVVNASVPVQEANAALLRLAGGSGDVLALVREDGAVLARSAGLGPQGPGARIAGDSPMLAAMRHGDERGLHASRSTLDGEARVVAYRHVEGYPVYASAARARSAIVAAWRQAVATQLAVGLPATGLLFLLAMLVRRRELALSEANDDLERRVAERTAELAQNEARLRRVQRVGRVGGFEIDLRSGANFRSAEYMSVQGRLPEARIEAHADWVERLHPDDRERAMRHFLEAVADDAPDTEYAQEYRILTPEGETRWIAARAEIERDSAGRALRMVGAHLDITELKAAQTALAEGDARLRAALRGARLGVSERHLPTSTASWDARAAEIYGGLTPERCSPSFAEWLERIHPEDRTAHLSVIRGAIASGGPDGYDSEFRFRRDDGGWNWVAVHGAVVERDPVTGRGVRLVGVVRDVTERRESEAALRESEARLRLAQEAGGIGTWEADLASGARRWSDGNYRLWGLEPGTPVTLDLIFSLVHPEDRARLQEVIASVLRQPQGRLPELEFRIHRASDGAERWLRSWGEVILGPDGKPARHLGVMLDVTERRVAEDALRVGEARLRLAVDAGRLAVWEADLVQDTVIGSPELNRLLGFPEDASPTIEDIRARIHPGERERLRTEREAALTGGERFVEAEFRYLWPDGSVRWLLQRAEFQLDAGGRPAKAVGVIIDVTDRKRTEEALRESEARLRLAQEAGKIGSWDWNLETGALHWSESCHRLFGTDAATAPSYDAWRTGIHPADRPEVDAALRAALDGTAATWEVEFRFTRLSDHELRWIVVRGSILRDPMTGRPRRVLGIALDTTGRRLAEEQLRLLARELDHRAKNALAVVQAAVRLTPKEDPAAYARAIEGRVRALARAHTLLAEGRWSGADLRKLVKQELAPFLLSADAVPRSVPCVELCGPSVHVMPAAAQGLSMALHELATNATKHGALSVPGGVVQLSWTLDREGDALRLRWVERGGPPVLPPTRRGFGSRVIEATVRDQLGGTVRRAWERSGLVCDLEIPLSQLADA